MKLIAVLGCVALVACGGGASSPSAPNAVEATPVPQSVAETVLIGAGDVGWPGSDVQRLTGAIVASEVDRGAVPFVSGDAEQSDGRYASYMVNYDPFWGSFRSATLAVTGNHDYESGHRADGFFTYFGPAGDPDGTRSGWFVKQLPQVTFIGLNSNVDTRSGSEQLRWLRAVLAAVTTPCSVAVWHHPRWSSARNGDNPHVAEFWNALYDGGVDVVVNGHDHGVEVMTPQNPQGVPDLARGIRQFIAGGGGAILYELRRKNANSEFYQAVHSVLRLRFRERSYGWEYLDTAKRVIHSDASVSDEAKRCH